jgi:hypothetical protein
VLKKKREKSGATTKLTKKKGKGEIRSFCGTTHKVSVIIKKSKSKYFNKNETNEECSSLKRKMVIKSRLLKTRKKQRPQSLMHDGPCRIFSL